MKKEKKQMTTKLFKVRNNKKIEVGLFQVKNVDVEKKDMYSKYCKEKGLDQWIPIEKFIAKLVK